MILLQRKPGTPILENKSLALGNNATAETCIDTVDERTSVSMRIGNGKVDRVGGLKCGGAVVH